ncbi:hypothetical protein [Plantactinospora sp. KLBMP9567]|uniref:hypothetical protein n=1 Tax=Plantactinospora sp. KLBMP9567 TaxID=3085900 RepID=UPI002981D259|nr:hypothetical protein [Plantactinospora sp. KLBMP9567]MDW5329615.1 hypothetical protein [Plantactinospora sp. KLBMP9567]
MIDAELFRLEAVVRRLDVAEARLCHLPDQSWAASPVELPADGVSRRQRTRTTGATR